MIRFKDLLIESQPTKDAAPTIWYHTTSPEMKAEVLKNGFVNKLRIGTYGVGVYFANPPEVRGKATITLDSSGLNILTLYSDKELKWDYIREQHEQAMDDGYDGISFWAPYPNTWYLIVFNIPKLNGIIRAKQ